MTLLEKQWQEFRHACYPPDLPKRNYIYLRRAFFGGAAGMLSAMAEVPVDKISAEDLLSTIQQELLTFNEDVKSGRA